MTVRKCVGVIVGQMCRVTVVPAGRCFAGTRGQWIAGFVVCETDLSVVNRDVMLSGSLIEKFRSAQALGPFLGRPLRPMASWTNWSIGWCAIGCVDDLAVCIRSSFNNWLVARLAICLIGK